MRLSAVAEVGNELTGGRRPGGGRRARFAAGLLWLMGLGTSFLFPSSPAGPEAPAPVPRAADPACSLFHHDLDVAVHPESGEIEVEDRIELPAGAGRGCVLHFLLHAGLKVECRDRGVALQRTGAAQAEPPALRVPGGTGPAEAPATAYRLRCPSGTERVTLCYRGRIAHPLAAAGSEVARGFSETPGLVEPRGVFLCGRSLWIPRFGRSLFTFTLRVALPAGWGAVSQGKRAALSGAAAETRPTAWDCPYPSEEAFLVAGPLQTYSARIGNLDAEAYLRTPDSALARRYLEATGRYIQMYEALVGPFPYPKFALVENFWETGYGMPSFTLLGEKVIRLPFILHSSYPHEILHNYWGNGVFVDAAGGNWSEGLTTYLADHLSAQGKGQDVEYRRTTLQKYADYVKQAGDFPLRAFQERRDASTEAVGYGKSMMVYHMLRKTIGDEKFREGLRAFYRKNAFRRASWQDVRDAFQSVAGVDLRPFFRQWVYRKGAPNLVLSDAAVAEEGAGGWTVAFRLSQVQPDRPFTVDVPVAVTLEGKPEAFVSQVRLDRRTRRFVLRLPGKPLRLDVDPGFDVFRQLDPGETPPSFSRLLGARSVVLVLPTAAGCEEYEAWKALAEKWAAAAGPAARIVPDSECGAIPAGASVWLFGWDNRLVAHLEKTAADLGAVIGPREVRVSSRPIASRQDCFAGVFVHPGAAGATVGWLTAGEPAAVDGLGRKIPHYGKYGWLTFEGATPDNTGKGDWPPVRSPLTAGLLGPQAGPLPAAARMAPARALASLPSLFSPDSLRGHVETLADPAWEGRGFGSEGLRRAADYIAGAFLSAGLQPGGEDRYFQHLNASCLDAGESRAGVNVVGVLPGKNPALKGEALVVGAHFDHLGRGIPSAKPGNEGKVHPGADDNASGVSILLELAKIMADGEAPARSVVFVAFTGEECGLLGARHFIRHMDPFSVPGVRAMINLDTVGGLRNGKLLVLGAASATEWAYILAGAGYGTGITHNAVKENIQSSDQSVFAEAGIPSLHLFTAPGASYHTPGDTPDSLDYAGMSRIGEFALEIAEYLANRKEPLTRPASAAGNVPKKDGSAPPRAAEGGRPGGRVGIGIVPDFAHGGPGVRVASVLDGGPAAQAGLLSGDVILAVKGVPVEGLQSYAEILKTLEPGVSAELTVDRAGAKIRIPVIPAARR